jgi:hypothetical protein
MGCPILRESLHLLLENANERISCFNQEEAVFPAHVVRMHFCLSGFSDDAVHAPRFSGQDNGVMYLSKMSQVCATADFSG